MKKLKIILKYKIILYVVLILIILLSYFKINNISYKNKENIIEFQGTLIDYNINGSTFNFILKYNKKKYKGIYYIQTVNEKNQLLNLKLGIKVKVIGDLSIPNNNTIPNTFNYRKYLLSNNIKYQIKASKFLVIDNHVNIFYKIKNALIRYINKFKSKSYLNTFILGDKKYLDTDIKEKYQSLGIIHIFAISGMHVSILTMILFKLLYKVNENIKYICIIFFLFFYLFITNFQCSIMRSVFFYIFLYLNKKFDYNFDIESVFLITIIMLLTFNYYYIINIGFLYSSIVSYTLIKYNFIIKGNYFIKLLKVSLLATLVSLPITINNNFEINLLSVFYNLIYVPLVSFILYPFALLTLLIPQLDKIYFILVYIVEYLSKFAFELKICLPKMNIFTIILYYSFIYVFLNTYNKKLLVIVICLLFINKYKYFIYSNTYVYVLDVNQGDAIIINKKNKIILVDTGGKIEYKQEKWKEKTNSFAISDNIIKFIKSLGYISIDYLVLTHGDYDHMGETINLVNNIKVDKVVFNNDSYNELENNLIKVLDKKRIKYYKGLKELNVTNNKLYFLNTNEYNNENDNSNVIYFKVNNYKFLFMGDAGVTREKDILEKYNLTKIDFIKIGHHGSNTSSSKYFIDSIKPKNCLISVGKNNRYGHPKESVIDILDDYCNIYRTDLNGSIEIKVSKNNYKIKTYSP